MEKFKDTLDQHAEMLTTAKDLGEQAVENAIDRIAEEIAEALRDNPGDTEKDADEMLNYAVTKSGVFNDN